MTDIDDGPVTHTAQKEFTLEEPIEALALREALRPVPAEAELIHLEGRQLDDGRRALNFLFEWPVD